MRRIAPALLLGLSILAAASPAQAQVRIETPQLMLDFNARGEMQSAVACHPACGDARARRLEIAEPDPLVGFSETADGQWTFRQSQERDGRTLAFTGPGGRRVTWSVADTGYGIELSTEAVGALMLQSGQALQPRPSAGFGNWLEQVRYVAIGKRETRQVGLDESESPVVKAEWAGFRSRFWAALVSAERSSRFELGVDDPAAGPRVVRPDSGAPETLLLYFGPVEPGSLSRTDPLLRDMMYAGLWFWLRWICFALFYMLGWLHGLVPVWGLAVMLLSIAVSLLMTPLSRAADRVQQQVHATEARLAPELSRIKKTYRGEEQAAKIIALYKTERVHPLYSLKSLLGVAIVIPVFIGAFDMLAENIHLMNTGFLWIQDLSRPDAWMQLPFEMPFFGSAVNLLPVLMTGLSVLASGLHRPLAQHPDLRRRQLRNMIALALVFFVLFYTFPAGMVLYWTTNNLISVAKGAWARAPGFRSAG